MRRLAQWVGVSLFCTLYFLTACSPQGSAPPAVPAEASATVGATTAPTVVLPSATATVAVPLASPTVEPTATDVATAAPTVAPTTEITVTPTETEVPTVAPTDVPATATNAPLPTILPPTATPTSALPTALPGNAANGAVLFQKMGCAGCHAPKTTGRPIAPNLSHIATEALTIIQASDYHGTATDAPGYIHESIVSPNAYVVPAFRYLTIDGTSIMPLDFGTKLTHAQIEDLVAYLMTMK